VHLDASPASTANVRPKHVGFSHLPIMILSSAPICRDIVSQLRQSEAFEMATGRVSAPVIPAFGGCVSNCSFGGEHLRLKLFRVFGCHPGEQSCDSGIQAANTLVAADFASPVLALRAVPGVATIKEEGRRYTPALSADSAGFQYFLLLVAWRTLVLRVCIRISRFIKRLSSLFVSLVETLIQFPAGFACVHRGFATDLVRFVLKLLTGLPRLLTGVLILAGSTRSQCKCEENDGERFHAGHEARQWPIG
jgi:hypothetical protein